jgi:Tfp pilus assembly protein PilW
MHKSIKHAHRITPRDEGGYSLVEVLVVTLLLALVVGTIMSPIVLSQTNQTRNANYSYAQEQARTGLDSMVSEIRQATAILGDGPNYVDMDVNLRGTAYEVYYECDIPQPGTTYRECMRVQVAQGGTLPAFSSASASVVVKNLPTTSSVFTFYPDGIAPYYMTATINVPASGGAARGLTNTIVFSDGALMRNLNVGN